MADKISVISNQAGSKLASKIADSMNSKQASVEFSKFANGEKRIRLLSKIATNSVFFVAAITPPIDESIIEILFLLDILERQKVKSVNVIIPWMGYSKQNRVFRNGEPLSASVVASLFKHGFIKNITLLDVHKRNILKFFTKPVVHKTAINLFVEDIRSRFNSDEIVIASADKGGWGFAKKAAKSLKVPFLKTYKHRDKGNGKVRVLGIEGNADNKKAILIDDGVLTGETIAEVALALKKLKAKEIHLMATHAVLTDGASEKINKLKLKSITFTNSVYNANYPKNTKIIDCSALLLS